MPITVHGAESLKGSHGMGDERIFFKTTAPLSLMTTYRMSLISAGSISLDSTLNKKITFITFLFLKNFRNGYNFLSGLKFVCVFVKFVSREFPQLHSHPM
jgi:hypothetical protein